MMKRLKQVHKWLRQQPEDFYAMDFGALIKRWDEFIDVCGGYVRDKCSFPGSSITYYTLYTHL
jgi:hypothetical protein